MKRQDGYRLLGLAIGVATASLGVACSSSTSPHLGTPCPTYSGGSATPATLAGHYNLVSFCQDTLPAVQGVTGTLIMTVGTQDQDSFVANLNVLPAPLAGPYTVSHDTITVNLSLGTFVGTYAFSGTTLSVSGKLPTNTPIAIVFGP